MLALPFTGGALSRNFTASPCRPTIAFLTGSGLHVEREQKAAVRLDLQVGHSAQTVAVSVQRHSYLGQSWDNKALQENKTKNEQHRAQVKSSHGWDITADFL